MPFIIFLQHLFNIHLGFTEKKKVNPQNNHACTSVWYVSLWDSYDEKSNMKQVPKHCKHGRARPNWFQYHARHPHPNSAPSIVFTTTIPRVVASTLKHILWNLSHDRDGKKISLEFSPLFPFSCLPKDGLSTWKKSALCQSRWSTMLLGKLHTIICSDLLFN